MLELHDNKAKRFLLCFMICIDKKVVLYFLEGNVFQGGWKILTFNVTIIGVALRLRLLEEFGLLLGLGMEKEGGCLQKEVLNESERACLEVVWVE